MKFSTSAAALWALAVSSVAALAAEPEKPKPISLPEVPDISVYADYEANLEPGPNIIRKIAYDWRSFETAKTDYPVDAIAAKRTARAKIKVGVGGDDSIVYCTPINTEKDEALAAGACDIIRKFGKFTHAVDASGAPAASDITLLVDWDIRPAIFAPPAPPPPPRWLETVDGRRLDMLAVLSGMARGELVQAPDWQNFAATDRNVPKKAKAVAKIVLDAAAKAEKCEIIISSGHGAIDEASCAALKAASYRSLTASYPGYKPSLALMVEWNGKNAKAVAPSQTPIFPVATPILFTAEQFPAGFAMPKWGTTVQLRLNASGKIERCLIPRTSGSDDADAALCAIIRRQGRFSGAKDAFGQPSVSGMYMDIRWSELKAQPPYDPYNR